MKEGRCFKRLLMEMKRYVQDHIIERGFDYYEQGLVEDIEIRGPWIHATVLGNYGDYDVRVHIPDFSKSRCNCPYDDYCKHMAAVVYYITGEYAGESDYMGNAWDPCVSAAGDPCRCAADMDVQQRTGDDLDRRLESMDKEELLQTMKQLLETNPSLRETVSLVLIERDQTASMRSDHVCRMGLQSSVAYYQENLPAVLKECESAKGNWVMIMRITAGNTAMMKRT